MSTRPTYEELEQRIRQLEDENHMLRQTKNAVRQDAMHLKDFIQHLPVMVYAMSSDEIPALWNHECERVTGYMAEEVIGNRHFFQQLFPENSVRKIMTMPAEQSSKKQSRKNCRITCKDGTGKVISWSCLRDEHLISGYETWYIGWDITICKTTEQRLREIERRFEFAMEGSGEGVLDWNVQTNEAVFSSRWTEILGYEESRIQDILTEWNRRIHPDDRDWVCREIQRHFNDETPQYNTIHRVLCKTGAYKWIIHRGKVIDKSSDGHPLRFVGTITDITEDKQTRDALVESEERFKILAENIPVGLSVMNSSNEFVYFNPQFTAMFGYDLDSVPDKQTWFLKAYPDPDVRQQTIALFDEDWGVPQKGMVREIILPVYTRDGRERLIHIRGVIMGNGKHLISYDDITEKKLAEDALRESEERFRTIFESAQDSIFIKDSHHRYTLVNPTMARAFNIPASELIGKTAEEVLGIHHSSDSDHKVLAGEVVNEILAVTINGALKNFHIIKVPIYCNSSEITGICGIARDITQTRQLEAKLRQAQKFEAIGTLAGGIAHDFNNILGAIIGFAELSLIDGLRGCFDRNEHNMKQIVKACLRARDLIKQILAISRKSDQNKQYIELQPIIKETVKLLRATLPSTIQIRQRIEQTTNCVLADSVQIHQIVMNLCTNAAHSMEAKGGILEIGLAQTFITDDPDHRYPNAPTGSYIRLTVTDTGYGMDQGILERIFDPYFTTKEKGKGTGLGLAVVNGIVKNCGGFIQVDSQVGIGTVVNIFLPSYRKKGKIKIRENSQMVKGNGRILFVDDEASLVEVSKYALEQLGYQVTALTSSLKAFELFRENPNGYDLVITDMTMPHMTGDELACEIMKIRDNIPVVMCTGFSEGMDRDRALAIGVKEFLLKPIIIKDLARVIRAVLN